MILVDTSVVIEFLRTGDTQLLSRFQINDAAICGITKAEVLAGTRDISHRQRLLAAVNAFKHVAMPESIWESVGDHLAALRRAGVTVPLADVVIATVAINHDVDLWTRDNQFQQIQTTLPRLRLFQGS